VRENAPMLAEDNYKEKYGEIDPNSPEFIALSLVKTKQFGQRSAVLSQMVEDEFAKVGRISGGSRQRQVGIWVLQATAMPSILVETGFITNPQEEAYLNSEKGQNEISESITKAIHQYVKWLEKKKTPVSASGFRGQKNSLLFSTNVPWNCWITMARTILNKKCRLLKMPVLRAGIFVFHNWYDFLKPSDVTVCTTK
jgi:N-acetylmuramoyl-L-alanine amidase